MKDFFNLELKPETIGGAKPPGMRSNWLQLSSNKWENFCWSPLMKVLFSLKLKPETIRDPKIFAGQR